MIKGGLIRPQLQRLGKISIGEKGEVKTSAKGTSYQDPKKLSFFTIRTHYRTEKGQLAIDTAVMDRLGTEPKELQIRLPFNQLERNFEYELRYYKGGMQYCSGDGEQGYRRQERVVKGETVYGEAKPFGPCGRACVDFQERRCKRFGALRVILEEQQQVGGVYEYRTTSRHSIENILSGLMTIQLQTGGLLAWLPLTMKLVPQTVTMPNGKTTRAYIVQIVYPGSPVQLLETVRDILALRAPLLSEIKALEAGMPGIEDDAIESRETQDEFYPDASKATLAEGQASRAGDTSTATPTADEVIRAIVATLEYHRPYTGSRDGAYTRFIPPDALTILREVFGVQKAKDLKGLALDALMGGYDDLLAVVAPAEAEEELDIVDAELLDDEIREPLDEGQAADAQLDALDISGAESSTPPQDERPDHDEGGEASEAEDSAQRQPEGVDVVTGPADDPFAEEPPPVDVDAQGVVTEDAGHASVTDAPGLKASRLHTPTAAQWEAWKLRAARVGLSFKTIATLRKGDYLDALDHIEALEREMPTASA